MRKWAEQSTLEISRLHSSWPCTGDLPVNSIYASVQSRKRVTIVGPRGVLMTSRIIKLLCFVGF